MFSINYLHIAPALKHMFCPSQSSGNASSGGAGPARRAPGGAGAPALGAAGSGAACTVCGRCFAPDRIEKHQEICRKAHAKKRKPFDALKHRLAVSTYTSPTDVILESVLPLLVSAKNDFVLLPLTRLTNFYT